MISADNPIANAEPSVRPTVFLDGTPLPPTLDSRLLRVVVDNDVNLPGMFELTFLDVDGDTLPRAGIRIGTDVAVSSGVADGTTGVPGPSATLIVGEVTAIEGLIAGLTVKTVVRGYTAAHRLQRAKRSRSFLNVTDADVARQLAAEVGLAIGTVVPTSTTHAYLPQVNQTDWEFLTARALEIGYKVEVTDAKFHFRPLLNTASSAGGGLEGMVRSAANSVLSSTRSARVSFPEALLSFRPRISAGNLTPDVEVRVWDPMARQAFAQNNSTPSGPYPSAAGLGGQFAPGALSGLSGGLSAAVDAATSLDVGGVRRGLDLAGDEAGRALSEATGGLSDVAGGLLGSPVGYLGPPPSPTARVLVDHPVAAAVDMATTGPLTAGALGSTVGGTVAEAEGTAKGDPAIQPGTELSVVGVPSPFAGTWRVSRARHVFDDSEHGYRTVFNVHGRQDRTFTGLTKGGTRSAGPRSVLDGVVCGVVSDLADPLAKGRVKVTLPWLAPDFDTDWAPNVQFCSGPRGGAMFMPEVGDEVLVAFEFGDPRRPYVIGAMMNDHTGWSVATSGPIAAGGLLGLASGGAALAGQLGGAALGGAVAGPLGGIVGGAVGSQVATSALNEGVEVASGAALAPGMVSEIHHRGIVSNTGNSLVFYDIPAPLQPPTASEVAAPLEQVTAETGIDVGVDAGGGTEAAGVELGVPPLASAVRLGSQRGEVGVTVDQVNCGVNISAAPVLGVTTVPLPNINISALNGFINIAAGPTGTMMVDGGANLLIRAATAITLEAPAVNILGVPLVNGIPIPL
ncbi:phage baseplate assembly protein V [Actinokineospora bangkokensis]|uniref:Gp5/Type VI secretion system Vgr protein OB-fold domain-containing protein n=1 Tax=Actinokineospora bangkokensis TaxID=1193682 RepID=A0A1Q9LK63_9PSEU|nr:phage baseplate assembly protein V [Actinokineospora bangkokensis]OLR92393.1 hypothetical protein BJP25_20110 [Actinokineospora bangkokensis]